MSRYLSRAVAAFVAVVLLTLIVPIALLSSRLAHAELRERADRRAAVVAAAITAVGVDRSDTTVARIPDEPGTRTLFVDTRGRVVADSRPGRRVPVLPELPAVVRGEPLTDDAGGVRAAAPVVGGRGGIVGAVIVVLSSTAIVDRTRTIGLALLAIGGVVIATAAAFGAYLARSLVRPVEQLDAQAEALAAGDLAARATVPAGPDELRRLAESFNDMSSRLAAMVRSQRAFTSDAAHQLRTPLTVLRLRLEALQDREPDDTDVTVAAAEVGRLQHLVDDLLALARLERGETPTRATPLGAVVREHCDLWSALAEDHGVILRSRVAGDGPVARAVPGAVEQIIDNFLENAIRVAPAGSDVVVSAALQDGRAVVRVTDRGPGLRDEDRERAFDRFWRGPDATADGGTGLGLAIVGRLVAASGGEARLDARPGGGTIAVAAFPADGSG